MAVTLLTGDESTDIINQSGRKIDMQDRISYLEPNNAPFVAMLRRIGKVKASSPKVEWLESESMPRFDTLSASATSAATALGATNPSYFRVGDGVRITETGEFVEVTGVSASAIGVNRGIGYVSAAAGTSATSAAGLYIVNNANAEGASLRTIKVVKLTNAVNYAEIIRTPFGVTGTVLASDFYGQFANERTRLQYEMGLHHEQQIESTFFWGASKEDTTTSGAPKRWCGGLYEYIHTNVTNAAGTLTRATFETFLRSAFRYGSDRKVLFASPLVMAALDGFAWNSVATGGGASYTQTSGNVPVTAIGVTLKTYYSSQGIVDIVMKRHWNDSPDLKGSAFLVDMDAVRMAYLRDTKLLMDRQANDADKVEDEFLTETSLIVQHERRHAYLRGVTG